MISMDRQLLSGICRIALVAAAAILGAGAVTLHASDIPVAPPETREAFREQGGALVASNGSIFLAAWSDYRGSLNSEVFAARFTPAGELLDVQNLPIALSRPARAGAVVALGESFFVFWSDAREKMLYATRVGSDGVAAAAVVIGKTEALLSNIVSNGRQIAFIEAGVLGRRLVFLDDELERTSVALTGAVGSRLILSGEQFATVYGRCADGCTSQEFVYRELRTDGSVGPEIVIGRSHGAVSVASSGEIALAAFERGVGGEVWVIRNGRVDRLASAVAGIRAPTAVYTGACFLVRWMKSDDSGFITYQYTAAGDLVGAPIETSAGFSPSASIATTGQRTALVHIASRSVGGTLHAETTSAVEALLFDGCNAEANLATVALSQSSPAHGNIALAPRQRGYFAAWLEFTDNWRSASLKATILGVDGRPLSAPQVIASSSSDVSSPAIGANATQALIAWTDRDGVAARIHDISGAVSPLLRIATEDVNRRDPPGVAWDGEHFVVTWGRTLGFGEGAIEGRWITPRGELVDPVPRPLGVGLNLPQMIPRHNGYVQVASRISGGCQILCPPLPPDEVYARRISRDGAVERERTLISGGVVAPAAAACNDATCLVVWPAEVQGGSRLHFEEVSATSLATVAQFDVDGTFDRTPPAVAWDGSAFTVAATAHELMRRYEPGLVKLFRYQPGGAAPSHELTLPVAPARYSSEPFPRISLASAFSGTRLLGYSRLSDATYGWVERAYARLLQGRQRIVRR